MYLVGYRETVWITGIVDCVRFYADGDSFNENLVKENWSEISGRWELKMAALGGRGQGGSKRGIEGGSGYRKDTIRLSCAGWYIFMDDV